MTFPDKNFPSIEGYCDAYFAQIVAAHCSLDRARVADAMGILIRAFEEERTVYACGNGGSASISNHLYCDFAKGIQTDTEYLPKVVSLSANVEMITAIANDIAYDDVFVYQLRTAARPGDVVMTISSSGDSENVVRALAWARENGVDSIAMTGFTGGRSAEIAGVHLHIDADNYGVAEDVHQSLMHILAQYIRLSRMDEGLVKQRKF